MATRLLLLFCVTGHVFATEQSLPDVDCMVMHLKYVHCTWDKQGTPRVNYTFYAWFDHEIKTECATYLSENSINTGCNQPYLKRGNRFFTFYTELVHGSNHINKSHFLKEKVKLNPPINLTVQMGTDSNLWFYWNQTSSNCVESEVRYRTNKKPWTDIPAYKVVAGKQSYCINLPSSNSMYELRVRSKIASACGESLNWSEWNEPVSWGFNNTTDTHQMDKSMPVWTPVIYALGTLTLILLVIMLLHRERLRVILIPVVPKPSIISHDIQDWLQLSKGLKESFKANYNERACPVSEYCHVSQSDSESSTSSVTTDQTDCSVFIPADESDLSTPCSSSSSTVSSEESKQVSP